MIEREIKDVVFFEKNTKCNGKQVCQTQLGKSLLKEPQSYSLIKFYPFVTSVEM